MQEKPEILAPAGSMEGLKAAVAAGCDAVYIGGNRFGARAYAQNPDQEEMLEAISYCHLHDVKLYMTVNTLLKEQELQNSLFPFLRPYYEAGLDAVIVQDMGVLRFIHNHFPSLAVHASTQMTLTMGKGTEELKEYHVTRMVPARELTIEELCQMRKDTDLELEVFVHGALCYCYSGQCLFSSMLGGRSGNRGRCAQPCRMPYLCQNSGEKRGSRRSVQNVSEKAIGSYILSPKELCNLPYLPQLIEAGIDSFKIEGRMKRPEYTALVTAMYRKYVDLYYSLGKKGYQRYLEEQESQWQEDLRCLAEIYNRNGFTQGYLEGLAGDMTKRHPEEGTEMLARLRPKHGGVCVGEVLSVGKYEVVYRTSKKLSAQDVVEFRNSWQQPVYEYTLGADVPAGRKVTARYQKGSRIQPGDRVYRTKDALLLEQIREKYMVSKNQLGVSGSLVAEPGKALQLRVERRGQKRAVSAECVGGVCQEAKKQPATEESVRRTLNQTGNSSFYFEELTIQLTGSLFLPVGELKKLRRQAFELLEKKLTECYGRQDTLLQGEALEDALGKAVSEQTVPGGSEQWKKAHEKATVFTASIMKAEQLEAVLESTAIQIVYLQTEQMSAKELKKAWERVCTAQKSPWLVMPAVFRHPVWKLFEKEWEKEDGLFSLSWDGFLVKNRESLHFLTEIAGVAKEKIRLDYNMYVMNREACLYWQEQGITMLTAPLEATKEELQSFSFLPQMELPVYGKIPLMVSAQCVYANTKGCGIQSREAQESEISFEDQKGRRFVAVNYCKYCYNIIYQQEPLYLRELAEGKESMRVSSLRYAFTTEGKKQTEQILAGIVQEKTQTGHFRKGIE